MFSRITPTLRESVFGIAGLTHITPNQIKASNGTGFMIAPGVIVTVAHVLHLDSDFHKPTHTSFVAIRAPEIGKPPKPAILIAQDADLDVAFLRIASAGGTPVKLASETLPLGTSCGALGFPLAHITFSGTEPTFNLIERFQGAHISAFHAEPHGQNLIHFYETDVLMYPGASGSPGFLLDGRVFGMHRASVMQGMQDGGEQRAAISLWIAAADIIAFAAEQGIEIAASH